MSLRTFQFRWKEIRYDRELLDRELCMTTFKKLSEKLEAGPEVKVGTKTKRLDLALTMSSPRTGILSLIWFDSGQD